MSEQERTKPYIYQPEPVNSPRYPRIYALSGPGVPPELLGKRYTKEEAEIALAALPARDEKETE